MRRVLMCSMVLTLTACAKKEAGPSATVGSGSSSVATGSGSAQPPAASETAPPAPSPAGSAATDGADEVAKLVVGDVGSKAFGGQTIDAACVVVSVVPSGDWTVAAAWLKDCGDKTARSILWVYKRKTGTWNEDYLGQPPKCWKGVPPDIARAVSIATKIPNC
jgi:hypothetical protein